VAKVVEATGSGVHTAFTILSVVVPGLLFGLLGGVTVDRVSRRNMLITTNIVRGIVALAAPIFLHMAPQGYLIGGILATNFLLSSVGQFNFPAEAALIPYLVAGEELLAANSAFNVSYLSAIAIGSGIWGPLGVRLMGPDGTYFSGGILLLASLVPLYMLAKDPPSHERAMRRSRYARLRHVATVVADIREGVSFALHNAAVSVAILALISQTALALVMAAVFPVVLSRRFGIPIYNLPIYLLPAGLGAGLGLLALLSPLGKRIARTRFVMVGNAVIALGLLGFSLSVIVTDWGLWGILAASPLLGAGFVVAYISGKSVLQEQPPDYLRGRVISLQLTLNNVVSLVPTVLAGWALDRVGPEVVFIAATLAFACLAGLCATWVRRMQSSVPG
jgi:MFS family permease